jgi:hypothetical protein
MRRMLSTGFLTIGLMVATVPARAQEGTGTITQVFVSRAKAGMAKQFLEGRKRHMAWHKSQADPWSWHTWEIASGEGTGSFLGITFNHHWKDFDAWEAKYGAGDSADVELNVSPYTEARTVAYYTYLPEFSRPPTGPFSKLAEVIHFRPKPDGMRAFREAEARIHEAIGKTNWPQNYSFYQLWNGGEPEMVLVLPRGSWAAMQGPDLTFGAMMTKAYGEAEATKIFSMLDQTLLGVRSEVLIYRPDLSYVPAQ